MITIDIPGFRKLELAQLVLDYNGTIARDGQPLNGVKRRLEALSRNLDIHVLTADTYGKVKNDLEDFPCTVSVITSAHEDEAKQAYVEALGCEQTVSIGNGRIDALMLSVSALGITVILEEGAASQAVMAADVCCTSIDSALDLLLNPKRLVATLRS
jgi:soluble P-type ATPase